MTERYITEAQANACLKIVQGYIDGYAGPGWEPKLYAPGHEGPYWNISLEGAEDWAILIGSNDDVTWPEGVWTEPVYSWCLALYPATL